MYTKAKKYFTVSHLSRFINICNEVIIELMILYYFVEICPTFIRGEQADAHELYLKILAAIRKQEYPEYAIIKII